MEEYDFGYPVLRPGPLRAVRSGLLSLVLSLASYTATPVERFERYVHDGIEILTDVPEWRNELMWPDAHRARDAISIITDEIDKYPARFLAERCGLERIYVVSGTAQTNVPGLHAAAAYSLTHDAFWITVDRDPRPLQFEYDIRLATVHEADHACNTTLRTRDDIEAWGELVFLPEETTQQMIEAKAVEGLRGPDGFVSWYAASTALTPDKRIVHLEDEASIKEKITYGWHWLIAVDDPVIDAKVDLLIDRYTDWSDGVMDREYFQNWHVPVR